MIEGTSGTATSKRMRGSARSTRAVAGLPVRIFSAQGSAFGIVQDFSCSGMFVRTRHSLALDSHCQVQIALPEKGELHLSCQVVRGADNVEAHGTGLGLCFDDQQAAIEPEKMERLGQLLVDIRALAAAIGALEKGQSLRGDLSTTPLASILSCLDADSTSGRLHIDNASTCGAIEVHHGRIVGFESETPTTRTGVQSIEHLLGCGFGVFVLTKTGSQSAPPQTIRVMDLLWRHLQESEDSQLAQSEL